MRTIRNSHNPLCEMLATVILMSAFSGFAAAQTANTSKAANDTATKQAAPAPATTDKLSPKDARQAQIAADTEKLYQMAQELKAEVAKSNKDILSIAVVKKADEIEKLAKSLKERMRSD